MPNGNQKNRHSKSVNNHKNFPEDVRPSQIMVELEKKKKNRMTKGLFI